MLFFDFTSRGVLDFSDSDSYSDESEDIISSSDSEDSESPEVKSELESIKTASSNRLKVIEHWLKDGKVDVNAKDAEHRSLLHNATAAGDYDLVDILIKSGAEIDSEDKDDSESPEAKSELENIKTASSNRLKVIEQWLKDGKVDVNAKDAEHRSLLHNATAAKVDVNTNDKEHRSLLHNAAAAGDYDLVDILIKSGAEIDSEAKDDSESPGVKSELESIKTESSNRLKAIEHWLKDGKVDVNAKDAKHRSLLHNAAAAGDYDLVDILIKSGAEIESEAKDDRKPLHAAAANGHDMIVKLLLENGADANSSAWEGITPLHDACDNGHYDVMIRLLDKGADINSETCYGEMPIHGAAEKGHYKIVKTLINKGADYKHAAHYSFDEQFEGTTPFHLACREGHLKVVALLYKKGSKVNYKNSIEKPPLHLAAEGGHEEVVKFLLNKRADVNCMTQDADTPLDLAVAAGKRKAVAVLLAGGAEIDDAFYSTSALHSAAESNYPELIGEFLKAGVDMNALDHNDYTPLYYASSPEMAETLISLGAELEYKSPDGTTALHLAAKNKKHLVVAFLLSKGADIHCTDSEGRTALHLACEWPSYKTILVLLENGANIHCRDNKGRTPLHEASRHFSHPYSNALTVLLEKGADVHGIDNEGQTPIHVACGYMYAKSDTICHLLKAGAKIECRDLKGRTPILVACENRKNNAISGESYSAFDYARLKSDNDRELSNFVSYLECCVIMMKSVNMYLCEKLLEEVDDKELNEVCTEELAKLKVAAIADSDLTLYKFLGKSKHQLVITLQNESLQEYFKSGAYKTDFPNYGVLISNQFSRGSHRKMLVDNVRANCSEVFMGLPDECILEVLGFFSNDELSLFSESFSETVSIA